MKPVPLHIVRYFKGEDTRLLSKHLNSEPAFQVANRFVNNLKDKINESSAEQVVVSITKIRDGNGERTLLSLTNRHTGPTGEGVVISLETQSDPAWDYPRYSNPRSSGSGHVATDGDQRARVYATLPKK